MNPPVSDVYTTNIGGVDWADRLRLYAFLCGTSICFGFVFNLTAFNRAENNGQQVAGTNPDSGWSNNEYYNFFARNIELCWH